ncbi:MAG: 5-dehydro-2-deoxygluconokinase [Balneolaceae bacterium]
MSEIIHDLICIGRSSIDLYSNDIGSSFEEINSFAAYVGGCPTNISVGTQRLGLRSALLTGVGEDPVGEFIIHFLNREKVNTQYIARKKDKRSSAVILGIEPPDKFPLVYYRDNCADIAIDVEDVGKIPFGNCRAILISGTGFSKEPSRSATLYAVEEAVAQGVKVILDVDFRVDQWVDLQTFGITLRSVLPLVDIIIGTTEEIKAAAWRGKGNAQIKDSQVNESKIEGDETEAVQHLLEIGGEILVLKAGTKGCYLYHKNQNKAEHVPGYPVEVQNTLGAGDAFASGFIYGLLKNWDFYKSARLGNACGAIVVTRHGCANFMPSMKEVEAFVEDKGGLT